jgi:hypothetical protein
MVEAVLGILVLAAFLLLLRVLGVFEWLTKDTHSQDDRRVSPRAYRDRFKR